MRYRSNKVGASYAVPSWLPEALGDDLQTLAAQRGTALDALVQEILQWGLADERTQEDAFSHIVPAFSDLTAADRRRLIQNAMRYGPDDPDAALLCAIVRAWLTVHAPEHTLTQPVSETLPRSVAEDS